MVRRFRSEIGLATTVVLLASVAACVWFCHTKRATMEGFEDVFTQVLKVSLGDNAFELVAGNPQTVPGTAGVTDGLSYVLHVRTMPFSIKHVEANSITLRNADALVAMGMFSARHFTCKPSTIGVERANATSGIGVYRLTGEQALDLVMASQQTPLDLAILARQTSASLELQGVRALVDKSKHAVSGPSFVTPEVLKDRALAGITMVVPPGASSCSALLRRYTERDGYIAFHVQIGASSVTVKSAIFKQGQAPRKPANVLKALQWDDRGELQSASLNYNAELMSWNEARSAMASAASVEMPVKRRAGPVVVEITPGTVRLCALPFDELVRSSVVRVHEFMPASLRSRMLSDASKPLQMSVVGGTAFAFPVGDLTSLVDEKPPFANEGQAIKCTNDKNKVYRYTNGQLRHYPSPQIASSWDKNWDKFVVKDCRGVTIGAPMQMR